MELNKTKTRFFDSYVYPILISVLILVGYFAKIEVYTIALNTLIVSIALITSKSAKPLIFFVLTYFFQLTAQTSTARPSDSIKYLEGVNPYILGASIVIFLFALAYFVFKNKLLQKEKLASVPLLLPLLVLSLGFLTNGFFSEDYKPGNLVIAFGLIVAYLIIYLVFYLGLLDEDPHSLTEYFTFCTILMSWILIIQLIECYTREKVLPLHMIIDRRYLVFGFGGCTMMGFFISTLIPMNMYGFINGKRPALSLITAFATLIASAASTSRNAMLVGGMYFALCIFIAMFFGKRKKVARILLPILVVVVAAILVYNYEKFILLVELYIRRGFDDAQRRSIWGSALNFFKQSPIFGVGFYGFDFEGGASLFPIFPRFAHSTIFELLAATGIFGALCYLFYRIKTIKLMLYKPTLERFMLMLGASVIVVESLIDNYVFLIFTVFYYTIACSIASLHYREQFGSQKRL